MRVSPGQQQPWIARRGDCWRGGKRRFSGRRIGGGRARQLGVRRQVAGSAAATARVVARGGSLLWADGDRLPQRRRSELDACCFRQRLRSVQKARLVRTSRCWPNRLAWSRSCVVRRERLVAWPRRLVSILIRLSAEQRVSELRVRDRDRGRSSGPGPLAVRCRSPTVWVRCVPIERPLPDRHAGYETAVRMTVAAANLSASWRMRRWRVVVRRVSCSAACAAAAARE